MECPCQAGSVSCMLMSWLFALYLLTEVNQINNGITTRISNYIHVAQRGVITYTCPSFNGVLVKSPLKVGHAREITRDKRPRMQWVIHA